MHEIIVNCTEITNINKDIMPWYNVEISSATTTMQSQSQSFSNLTSYDISDKVVDMNTIPYWLDPRQHMNLTVRIRQ